MKVVKTFKGPQFEWSDAYLERDITQEIKKRLVDRL